MSRGRGRANNQTKAGRDRAGQVAQLAQLFLLLVWGEQAGGSAQIRPQRLRWEKTGSDNAGNAGRPAD